MVEKLVPVCRFIPHHKTIYLYYVSENKHLKVGLRQR